MCTVVINFDHHRTRKYRLLSVFVCFWLASCAVEYQKYDSTNKRNKADEVPPATLSDVMKTTYCNCKARKQKYETCDEVYDWNESKDEAEKEEVPIL